MHDIAPDDRVLPMQTVRITEEAERVYRESLTKYTVSEVRQRIETPLADARCSDRSGDRISETTY